MLHQSSVTFWEWAEAYTPEILPFPKMTSNPQYLYRWKADQQKRISESNNGSILTVSGLLALIVCLLLAIFLRMERIENAAEHVEFAADSARQFAESAEILARNTMESVTAEASVAFRLGGTIPFI